MFVHMAVFSPLHQPIFQLCQKKSSYPTFSLDRWTVDLTRVTCLKCLDLLKLYKQQPQGTA